jgi:hypothetical protein
MKKGIILLLFTASTAQAIETTEHYIRPEPIRSTVGLYENDSSQVDVPAQYASNRDLREEKKIGFGSQIGGNLGAFGLNLEVNIDSANSAVAGVGMGPGYGTFQILWKRHWEGKYFTPYMSAGWSRWYNSDESNEYKKSLILSRALTEEQKSTGRFSVDFMAASAGMQYQQLSGEFSGWSFFMEFGVLSAIKNLTPVLTGALGGTYYY